MDKQKEVRMMDESSRYQYELRLTLIRIKVANYGNSYRYVYIQGLEYIHICPCCRLREPKRKDTPVIT